MTPAERIAALIRATGTDDIDRLAEAIADACGPEWMPIETAPADVLVELRYKTDICHYIRGETYHLKECVSRGYAKVTRRFLFFKRVVTCHPTNATHWRPLTAAHWAQTKLMVE